MKHSRESYIPKGALKISDKQSDAVAYLQVRPTGIVHLVTFCGKRQKPDWNYTYSKRHRADVAVEQYFKSRRATLVRIAEDEARKKASRETPIKLEIGTVLTGSWGYEQTNVEAWQVVRIVGKQTVEIRRVGTTSAGHEGNMSEHVIPCPDGFIDDKVLTKRVFDGNRIRLDHCSLSPWSGQSLYSSWYH